MSILRFKYLENPLRWAEIEVPLDYKGKISPNNDEVIIEFHKKDLTEDNINKAIELYNNVFKKNNFKKWQLIIN